MYINLIDDSDYTLSKNLNTQKSFSFGNIKKRGDTIKKKLWLLVTTILLITSLFIGCFDEGVNTNGRETNLILESTVVKLYNYSINFIENEGEIVKVEVEYLFINIAPRDIKVNITAEFYDKNDNLLGIGPRKNIELPKGYTEKAVFPANIISYDKEDVANVDHVKLIVEEI